MMLATWLVEFYLSKCNELDDLVASESISQDVDNFRAEKTILEDDLRQFLETYKVAFSFLILTFSLLTLARATLILPRSSSLSRAMDGQIYTFILPKSSAILRG